MSPRHGKESHERLHAKELDRLFHAKELDRLFLWRAVAPSTRRAWPHGVAGFVALALYGIVPVLQAPANPFGRVYAAYGAAFIVLSIVWGAVIDRQRPDARDCLGAVLCVAGALVMMWPRAGG